MLMHCHRDEIGELPLWALTVAGKELQVDDGAATAGQLLEREAVKVVPVLDGRRYVGVVGREALAGTAGDEPLRDLAADVLPVANDTMPAGEALALLDVTGATRLVVVLDDDARTYVGIVCLRGDRRRLCVDPDRLAAAEAAQVPRGVGGRL